MFVTLCVLAAAAFFFVQGKIRSDLVALSALLLLMLTGILTPEEALSGFSNSIVIVLVGVFIVGGAVFRTGLAKMISRKILALAGRSETKLFFLIMMVTSGIGAFVSNTGTVAVMLPIVVSLSVAARTSPSRFLMPLAFASSMGGMLTLIGTTPNLIINNALIETSHGALHFFSFFPVGVVCVTLGTVSLALLSKWLLTCRANGERKKSVSAISLRDLADKYSLMQNVYRARVEDTSPLAGETLRNLELPRQYGVSVVEIRRKAGEQGFFERQVRQIVPGPDTTLFSGDLVSFIGNFADIHELARKNSLALLDAQEARNAAQFEDEFRFDTLGIAELVILSTSNLLNQQVKDAGLREKYSVSVLGMQRRGETLLLNVTNEKIRAGDSLLVKGEWGNIARLEDEVSEWVVVGQPLAAASQETLDHKAPLAAVIAVLMIVSMACNALPAATAVMLAALCLVFTGCFRNVEEAYKTINWESTVLVAAMLPVSLAIEKTGISTLVSAALVDGVGSMGPYALMAAIYAATSITTLFISNTATALLFTPIALQASQTLSLAPHPFLFAVAVAASMCFASPFSTPPNVLVMSPGRYVFMDYVKVGVPLQMLFGIVMVFILPIIFPFGQ